MAAFVEWESFYVIVGGGAAALIGLQFVVMTLIAERPQIASPETGAAFATPTIVHFSTVLLLAAIVRAPWESVATVAALWGAIGFLGMAYCVVVVRRMRRQKSYQPDWEDLVFHFVLPLAAYAVLLLSSVAANSHEHEALFGLAAGVLFLLFIGIHNVWDTVAYHVFVHVRNEKTKRR